MADNPHPSWHNPRYYKRHPEARGVMPTLVCNYSTEREKRERNELIATWMAIVFSLVPMGFTVPVLYRWPLWGVSVIATLYLALTILPNVKILSVPPKMALGIAISAAAFVVFWPVMRSQWKAEKSSAIEGDIKVKEPNAKMRNLEIGDSGTVLGFGAGAGLKLIASDLVGKSEDKMQMLYNAGLRLDLENGSILVSTPIRDREGHLVASVEKNHWSVTSSCLDKNYSDDSFEVLDRRGLVVFQMKLFPDRVQIQGEWRDEFGHGVRLRKEERGGGSVDLWMTPEKEQKLMQIIKARFVYPSQNHWGELR